MERSAEFFGFYNMIGKFAAVLGPLTVGGVTLLVRSLGAESTIAARAGIASIIIFFLRGEEYLFLKRLNIERRTLNFERRTTSGLAIGLKKPSHRGQAKINF